MYQAHIQESWRVAYRNASPPGVTKGASEGSATAGEFQQGNHLLY